MALPEQHLRHLKHLKKSLSGAVYDIQSLPIVLDMRSTGSSMTLISPGFRWRSRSGQRTVPGLLVR